MVTQRIWDAMREIKQPVALPSSPVQGVDSVIVGAARSARELTGPLTYGGELTIASGLISASFPYHSVDTEGDAASDTLAGAYGVSEGMPLLIRPESDARTIIIGHNDTSEGVDGTRFFMSDAASRTLDDLTDAVLFWGCMALDSGNGGWLEVPGIGPALAAHIAAADPHTGYQKESEKDAASGYAGLTAGTKLNLAQMQEVIAYADLTDDPAVLKSLYDAQTILAATADDTPVALTVAEQRIVGRITGGNIAALTAAQIRTLLGLATYEKTTITIPTPAAADDFTIGTFAQAMTLYDVSSVIVAGTNVVFNLYHGTDRSAAGTKALTADVTETSKTTGTVTGGASWADATMDAGAHLRGKIVSVSGAVTELSLTIRYSLT